MISSSPVTISFASFSKDLIPYSPGGRENAVAPLSFVLSSRSFVFLLTKTFVSFRGTPNESKTFILTSNLAGNSISIVSLFEGILKVLSILNVL